MESNTHPCHCWNIVSQSKRDVEDEQFFRNYFDAKRDFPDFPFVIFANGVPNPFELAQIQGLPTTFQKTARPIILVLKQPLSDVSDCLQMLITGIDDMVEWSGRNELVVYFESKYAHSNSIKKVLDSAFVKETLIGSSIIWNTFLFELIETILFSQAPVLLIGESGTGKELISNLIHTVDLRKNKKNLIVVDCTTIVAELSGSELFGHERGSYTNAVQSREGAVALANGGTLFLDEIGELPLNLQPELLRVLQEGTYKKIGSNTWQKSCFRLVCATNRNLLSEVEQGRFRQDLYFRISDCQLRVPSLDERREDIPALVDYFLTQLFEDKERPELDKPVLQYLLNRPYVGNIRELRQLVQRMALKHVRHNKITIGELPAADRQLASATQRSNRPPESMEALIRKALLTGEDWWKLKDRISETAIEVALDLENNNKQKAAKRLGVDVRTVQQYVKKKVTAALSNL